MLDFSADTFYKFIRNFVFAMIFLISGMVIYAVVDKYKKTEREEINECEIR